MTFTPVGGNAAAHMSRAAETSRVAGVPTKRRVLIVDDERDIVDLVKYNLNKNGYDALVAYDGNEALDIAQRELPDLIVLDLMMAEVNGFDVVAALNERPETRYGYYGDGRTLSVILQGTW